MTSNQPTPLPPPTPPRAPAGASLPVPTAEACLSCGTRGGYIPPRYRRPWRARSLCRTCYERATDRGTVALYPACGPLPVPYLTPEELAQCKRGAWGWEPFLGVPESYTPPPTGWPAIPALVAPLHPPLPAATRWGRVVWFSRPQHDPIGRRLFDAETRHPEIEAAA